MKTNRQPVLKDGKLENFTIKLSGKDNLEPCPKKCGCNVFHKPDNQNLALYKCNSCGIEFVCK